MSSNTTARPSAGTASAGPTTAGPTTAGPTTAGPTTAGPTTAGPTTAGPTTAGPTTAGPTTAGPTTAGPTTAGPTAAGPTTAGPGSAGPDTHLTAQRRGAVSALTFGRTYGTVGIVGIAATLVIFAGLHLLPPTSDISPIRRTISEYALTSSAWAFNLAVLCLAVASVAVLIAAVRRGRVGLVSGGTIAGALWIAGLLTLIGFPKHNWAQGGPSTSGSIHRVASLIAFVALPIAVMLIARRRGASTQPASARWAHWLGVLSLLWFSPLLFAIISAPMTGRPWWQAIALGLVERGLALTEVLALLAAAFLVRSRSDIHRENRENRLAGAEVNA
ncbi:hypothetical protein ABIB25_002308 [Nakamurella sp. UYEF19]|uniref:DUF998 domain-containing protein n=1 Tax=Nakamurella sp. UYEF19 TaxID=1756392 RepID=UPI00339973E2